MSQVMKISFVCEEATANGVSQPHSGSKPNSKNPRKTYVVGSSPNSNAPGAKKSSGRGDRSVHKGIFLCSIETGDDCKLSIYDEADPNKTRFRKGVSRKKMLLDLCDLFKKAAETTEEEEEQAAELSGFEGQQMESSHPGGVSFITVYRGIDMSIAYVEVTPKDLSTLVVTRTGEVYGKGWNSLHCCPFRPSMVPMKEGTGDTLKDFVKIDMLQGLKVKKIAVDEFFGVALTWDKKLYKWGCYKDAPDEVVVMLQEYRAGPCHCGKTSGGKSFREGSAELMYCTHDQHGYKAYTASDPPPPGIPTRKFISHDGANVLCPKCHKHSTPSLIPYGGHKLSQCPKCKCLLEAKDLKDVYVKIPIRIESEIVDMDCTEELLWTLSEDNLLLVRKYDLTQSAVIPVRMSPGEVMNTVNCGQRHVAIVTNQGSVYCYGNRGHENPKDRSREGRLHVISLWKGDVPGRVVKVNCGRFSTICLLEDRSLCIIEKEGVVSKVGIKCTFPSVSAKPLLDITYKLKYPFYGKRGKEVMKNLNEFEETMSSLTSILVGTHPEEETPWGVHAEPEPKLQQEEYLPGILPRELYGKTLQSDLTLRLANGEFPVHCSVLMSSSAYFKTILAYGKTPSTLDMMDYNPRAYKCLLQHLYHVTPDPLILDDLLDMLDIAIAYKETDIINNVIDSLIAKIEPDTVIKILLRNKPIELVNACLTHVQSPEYKTHVSEILMHDPSKDLILL